jgi:hypothetical protein
MKIINNQRAVLDMLSAKDEAQARRHVYKYTDCGAWIKFEPNGVMLGSIVEGCYFGCCAYRLAYPFTEDDFDARIKAIEKEADALWKWANEQNCEGDAPDVFMEFLHFMPILG